MTLRIFLDDLIDLIRWQFIQEESFIAQLKEIHKKCPISEVSFDKNIVTLREIVALKLSSKEHELPVSKMRITMTQAYLFPKKELFGNNPKFVPKDLELVQSLRIKAKKKLSDDIKYIRSILFGDKKKGQLPSSPPPRHLSSNQSPSLPLSHPLKFLVIVLLHLLLLLLLDPPRHLSSNQ
jgi:hypothetical protein